MTETPIKRKGNAPSVPCSSCGRLLWWHTSYNPQTTRCQDCRRAARGLAVEDCPVCGKRFTPKPGVRSCSPCCGGILAARTRGSVAQRTGRTCEICGTTYRATYSSQRTCSRSCGKVMRYGPPKPKPAPEQASAHLLTCHCGAAFLSIYSTARWCDACRAAGLSAYRPVDGTRSCRACGTKFASAYTGGRRRAFCGPDCANLFKAFRISPTDRLAIYRRDAFLCHLCGRKVRRSTVQDPWYASLDHLVPRSRGGSDDPTNLATAHLWCNIIRGTDDIPTPWPHGTPPASW